MSGSRAPGEPLRVIVAHNEYQQRGGEDAVVTAEVALLREHGHAVHEYRRRNDDIHAMGRVAIAADTLWSRRTVADIGALVASFRPDVLHVHNTLPLISPSIYWAAARHGLPVVQTLHNFRLMCPQAMLLRDGKVCEDCVGKLPWRGTAHGCYRGSVAQSSVLTGMIGLHRTLGTWQHKVDRYIALNDFCRAKFIEGGLPAHKLVVKPNFVDLPSLPNAQRPARDGFLYVGRLSAEKGCRVLAGALASTPGMQLRVIGTGPEQAVFDGLHGVDMLGALPPEAVYGHMRSARALVMPSVWYENFPRTLVEAFACGLPIIASRIGALASLVADNVSGMLFNPGSATDLAEKMAWAQANPARMAEMGVHARAHYQATLTGRTNYPMLTAIYKAAIQERRGQRA